jgi:hypothetical protein
MMTQGSGARGLLIPVAFRLRSVTHRFQRWIQAAERKMLVEPGSGVARWWREEARA